ncbi:MAG TPA: FUSC family protein [Terriglobia bacterium]|nr:FUSC family protein [Terriglobia bacterium]
MAHIGRWAPAWLTRQAVVHSVRTAVAATVSLLVARLFRLPESYWAAITTLVVMQSTLGAAWTVSRQRFAGTALGAAMGAFLAGYFGTNLYAFGAGVFAQGLICEALRLDRAAYRFSSVTLAVVMLIARSRPVAVVAVHRFVEVSVGIAVGLLLTLAWPERDAPAP